ncbi:GntR family transcriptional regulator [Streptomyces sp. NPDC049915]|uniref:GntR family transcriptional regulator n=1 Tax=Streptomyces sp. NPDC049915 TaxID=3155510 RepID=UPI003448D1C2
MTKQTSSAPTGAQKVVVGLMALIENGDLSPGDPIPKTADLAEHFGVNKNTASRAVQLLKERGVLSGKAGGTTRVRVPPMYQVRSTTRYQIEKDRVLLPEEERRTAGVAELDSKIPVSAMYENHVKLDVLPAPADVAEVLGLEPGALVLRRIGTRRHREGAGESRSVSYMPHDLAVQNPALFDPDREPWPGGSLHQLYTLGVEVERIEDTITAYMPSAEEMERQDIPLGVPIMHVRKISYSTSGDAVEVTDIPFPADRIKLHYVTPLRPW